MLVRNVAAQFFGGDYPGDLFSVFPKMGVCEISPSNCNPIQKGEECVSSKGKKAAHSGGFDPEHPKSRTRGGELRITPSKVFDPNSQSNAMRPLYSSDFWL